MESQSVVKIGQWARVDDKSESVALCVWQCHLRNVSTRSNRTPVFEEDGKWIALAEEMG